MATSARSFAPPVLLPTDFSAFRGEQVPDPITFVIGKKWLDKQGLYPRQATLIKIVFLRTDLLTEYDLAVIDGWEKTFLKNGNEGVTPGVIQRMEYLREQGHKYFREVLLVLGRRAGKGYVSALCMAYVIWGYLAKGDPQEFYGIDRDKKIAILIYAGKKEQARENLWRDLISVILGAPCFNRYISRSMAESLSLFSPKDFNRIRKLKAQGVETAVDQATFMILPKEATTMSGRGPATAVVGFDEFAHVPHSGITSSAKVWDAVTPSLDQFGKDAFIIEPSSPWTKTGQFYANWEHALSVEDGVPEYPNRLVLQLPSWDIYENYEIAQALPLLPEGFTGDLQEYANGAPLPRLRKINRPIQSYDEDMQKLEKANPDTFKVERRSHWQSVMDAYLDEAKIDQMFGPTPWDGEPLQMQHRGMLSRYYKAHADPSLANANFGFAIGHPEIHDGVTYCVFDVIHHWNPADFPDHTIDYLRITDELWEWIKNFVIDSFTFDQWNSAAVIQTLIQRVNAQRLPKRVEIHEETATAKHNWERAEAFKVALNQGWIKAPYYEQASQELKFLQLLNGNKVEKQESGPVVTKDVADCHDSQTEVLTESGWKLFKDVQDGERVATRSPSGDLEYQNFTARVARHYEGPMVRHAGYRLDFSVTPHHRMLIDAGGVERFVPAQDLPFRSKVPKTTNPINRDSGKISLDADQGRPMVTEFRAGRWDGNEDAVLAAEYAHRSMPELQNILGRTRDSIYNRAKALRLTRGQIGDRYSDRPDALPVTDRVLFAKFLGFWLADGRKYHHGTHRGYGVKVHQKNPLQIAWFDQLMDDMAWPVRKFVSPKETTWTVRSHGLREYLKAICQGDHELKVPGEVFSSWSYEEVMGLLEGLTRGDGIYLVDESRPQRFSSTSRVLVDDVQRLMAHAGMVGQIRKVGVPGRHQCWSINADTKPVADLKKANVFEEQYSGVVYCLTVPNSTLLTRRNGVAMWSGNCLMEVVWDVLGDQINAFMAGEAFRNVPLRAGLQGSIGQHNQGSRESQEIADMFSSASRRAGTPFTSGVGIDPSRGPTFRRHQ